MLLSLLTRAQKLLSVVSQEMSWVAKALASLLAFIAPLHPLVGVMMFFLMADTLSAIYLRFTIELKRQRNCPRSYQGRLLYSFRCFRLFWKVFDGSRFEATIGKVFSYPMIALACFVFDSTVLRIQPGEDGLLMYFSFTNLCFALICFYDFQSFLRNMGRATGNKIFRKIEELLTKKVSQHAQINLDDHDQDLAG
jgi:hypothetical protein